MNLRLAAYLAWRSLRHHRNVAIATILGVALGMTVVASILIVDHHSIQARIHTRLNIAPPQFSGEIQPPLHILRVSFERAGQQQKSQSRFPSQEAQVSRELSVDAPPGRRGEEDYQAMRLAVRLASLLAFSVGAVIVFYTMRFSVTSRSREFCLLLCLGEKRANVVLSLLLETLGLGLVGTLLGLLVAFPAAIALIHSGISTTGRVPTSGFEVPWAELVAMGGLSVLIALLAVVGPAWAIVKMNIVDVLQPRFLTSEIDERSLHIRGFGLLLPPLLAAAYLSLRPFLLSWLSVVHFFLFESVFVLVLTLVGLWWMTPLLRGLILLFEKALKPSLPLETLLTGRRMRLTSQKLVFTLAGVTLVFSLLTALHDITRSLKHEIQRWSEEALSPYAFVRKNEWPAPRAKSLDDILTQNKLYLFRLSDKVRGEFPFRLIAANDVNPYLQTQGKPPLLPGNVLVSRTLAARFGLKVGDIVLVESDKGKYRFPVSDVTDIIGFYAEDDQYVDLKSYLLFSDGNPLFADNLERSLGRFAMVRNRDAAGSPSRQSIAALQPFYTLAKEGYALKRWQQAEIDRDFLIFDYILAMTIVLAALGVTNNILIQVHTRGREFSVLRTLGVTRLQTMRLLWLEGNIIGLVAALLSLLLGNALGAISVSFLDRFTLFEYQFVFSVRDSLWISGLALATCSAAAIYPALVANRISSAESLHYE